MVKKAEGTDGVSEGVVKFLQQTHDYAIKHYEIIKKFGRFPHRNECLGRESTPEEVEYLKTANTFG